MKTKTTILKISTVLVISAAIIFTACKKDSHSSTNTSNNAGAQDLSANGSTADAAYSDAFTVALQTGSDQSLDAIMIRKGNVQTDGLRSVNGINGYYCATVTASGSTFPVTVTVDFGSGCTSADSITRSGSITYVFSGRLRTPGTTISATFNNYTVNGYQLGGTYAIENTSSGSNLSLSSTITSGTIVFPDDSSYSFAGTKTTSLSLAGIDTTNLLDNQFSITGNYMVSNSSGQSLVANVTTPLVRELSCRNIVSGVISFIYTASAGGATVDGTLDYGSGTCDNSAVITIGAATKTITLPW
jgi:hypothetical protein